MSNVALESVAAFAGLVDLAAENVGGQALSASDEFFAGKENLLKPGRGIFLPDEYTENGKWMDGWESRRKRVPGYDWCIIQLGIPGNIVGVDIDTNHFLGNHPPYASVEACVFQRDPTGNPAVEWKEILPKSALRAGSQNLFATQQCAEKAWTHLRLNIYPDGGVARFRVYGEPRPEWTQLTGPVDLALMSNGGKVLACSDMFFGPKENLIRPGRAKHMGEGWESKRRRGPGCDWIVVQLAKRGILQKIEVDTNHFKGNYPDRFSLEALDLVETESLKPDMDAMNALSFDWQQLLPETKLQAHHQHYFEIASVKAYTHVKLTIYPDGGVSRLRVIGTPAS